MIPNRPHGHAGRRPAGAKAPCGQQLVPPLVAAGGCRADAPAADLNVQQRDDANALEVALEIETVAPPASQYLDVDADHVVCGDVDQADVVDVAAAAQFAHRHLLYAAGQVARLRAHLAGGRACVAV